MYDDQPSSEDYRFHRVYRMPGEGLIAEFRSGDRTRLYDVNGLRYRIVKRRAAGADTSDEDKALAILVNFEDR